MKPILAEPQKKRRTQRGHIVNDVHSRLNRTTVSSIERPTHREELLGMLSRNSHISISGSRHAMGGQQFRHHYPLIDLRALRNILDFDTCAGTITCEAGICWPELLSALHTLQPETDNPWSINQKQTGADDLTLGGALSANIHGRGLQHRPFIQDVVSFELIIASGEILTCSRNENAELFSLAIGGYGLFGTIYAITLQLTRRLKVQRRVQISTLSEVIHLVESVIDTGALYGDFQLCTDEGSPQYLREGIFTYYQPVAESTPLTQNPLKISLEQWRRLLHLAHFNKGAGYRDYCQHYLSTQGQIYWSDTHQLNVYENHYHQRIDDHPQSPCAGSEMITELYVPRESLEIFLARVRRDFREYGVNVIYSTVRWIRRDGESFLPWAKDDYACIIFNIHIDHTETQIQKSQRDLRRLIDRALNLGGNYFLTYHRFATAEQVLRGYPQFPEFLRLKKNMTPRKNSAVIGIATTSRCLPNKQI